MDLFPFIDALFCKIKYKNVSDSIKYKHFYMVNRFLSIRYPLEINACQIIGLGQKNSARMMDYWHNILTRHYTRNPSWLMTKSGKKQNEVDVLKGIDKSIIIKYCVINKIDMKTINGLAEFFPKELKEDIKKYVDKDELKKMK